MIVNSRWTRRMPKFAVALSVIAIVAVMSAGASAAQAAVYPAFKTEGGFVNYFRGVSGATTGPLTMAVPGMVNYEASEGCTISGGLNGGPSAPGRVEGVKIVCQGMHIVGSACVIKTPFATKSGEFVFNSLKGSLVWLNSTGSAAGLLLSPTSGEKWATFTISGCALAETWSISGTALMPLSPEETEVASLEGTLSSPAITSYWTNDDSRTQRSIGGLRYGTKAMTLIGAVQLWQTSGHKTGVFGRS